ncbi:hypothetical protein NW762_003139 [Fusarium torreyae]|uniref:Beta-lactamase-related domain-containing protein n=1 Tax=Fusarium torreyae TaxID=1237075 RepID=A0A9W8S8P5_9HYPO|nr:hypothetical protein NW762_003139 [Fusarium torreyae]
MHVQSSLACMALAAGSAAASIVASDNVPLLGPSFLSNFDVTKSKHIEAAKNKFPKLIDVLFDSGTLNKTDLVFSIDVFSASTNESIYSYHHVGESSKKAVSKGRPSENSIYRIGSVTKMLTAYAIIAKAGMEILSHPVTIFLPELAGNASDNAIERIDWNDITVGALLAHQGGTSDPGGYYKVNPDDTEVNDREAFFKFMRDTQYPTTTPSRNAVYSDAGWGVATMLLERLTGLEYKDAIKHVLFEPLGMNSSSAVAPNGTDVDEVNLIRSRGPLGSTWGTDTPLFAGSGGIYSSIKDLRRAGLSILNSEFLKPSTIREWMKPRSGTGAMVELVGAPWEIYRLTLPTGPDSNRTRVSDLYTKSGGNIDYSCMFGLSPDHGIGYSIMIAGNATASFARFPLRDIVAATFITSAEYAAAENAEENLTGTFVVEGSETTNLTLNFVKNEPGLKLTSFFVEGQDALAKFVAAHVFPTGLYSNSRSLAALYNTKGKFSAAFRQITTRKRPPPDRSAIEGGHSAVFGKGGALDKSSLSDEDKDGLIGMFDNTISWMAIGGDGATDEFVLHLEDGKVVGITNPGLGLEFTRAD